MPYKDFDLDSIRTDLGLSLTPTILFPVVRPTAVPAWLPDMIVVYGCVTTGEVWQFLRHDVTTIAYDTNRYAVQQLDLLLGVFRDILK